MRDLLVAVLIDFTLAVIPQADGVEVLQRLLRVGLLEDFEELVVDVGARYIFEVCAWVRVKL